MADGQVRARERERSVAVCRQRRENNVSHSGSGIDCPREFL